MIESDDQDERYLARAKVAQEFRRIIDVVELHDDRRITVRTKPDGHGWQTEYLLTSETIESVRVILPNGQTTTIAMEVLHGVVLVHPEIPGCDRMSIERATRQSIRLAAALSNKRIRVDRTPDGNFAAVLIDGPKLDRLPMAERSSPFDEKPTCDAKPATGVLDERETETATGPANSNPPIRSFLVRLRGHITVESSGNESYSVKDDRPPSRILMSVVSG
jgi:hypothetical protein